VITEPGSSANSTIRTGRAEIDRCLKEGIGIGSLVLVEGRHATGKSLLCQHLAHGALGGGLSVAYYTSEDSSPSLISRSAALGLDLLDHFLLDRLRIYSLEAGGFGADPGRMLERLFQHLAGLPPEYALVVVDSVSALVPSTAGGLLQDFLEECRLACRQGRAVVLTLGAGPGVAGAIARLCPPPELRLRLELAAAVKGRVVRTLEAVRPDQHPEWPEPRVAFQVEPGWGFRETPWQQCRLPLD
jgi:archaellum biogenesis ATPase FlaH